MANYFLGILGILVSVLLFLLGYRQTVGAKRERIAAANSQLEAILIRRIVLEKHTPSLMDLLRLIEGKARDHNVRSEDLISEGQLLNTIFTRVTESDLIPAEQRDEILGRIVPVLTKYEAGESEPEVARDSPAGAELEFKTRFVAVMLFAIASALVGGLVAALPELRGLHLGAPLGTHLQVVYPLLATMIASLGVIAAAFTFLKLRASQEETSSKMSEISTYRQFENQVARVIKKSSAKPLENGSYADRSFDFVVELNGRRVGIEAKSWVGRHLPKSLLDVTLKRIGAARERANADEAILVTQVNLSPFARNEDPKLKIMNLRELEAYLR